MSKEIPIIEKIKEKPAENIIKPQELSGEHDKTLAEDVLNQKENDQKKIDEIKKKLETPAEKEKIFEEAGEKRAETLKRAMTDITVKVIPGIGELSMIVDGVTGKNLITKEKMTGKERIFNVAVGVAGGVLYFVPVAGEAAYAARVAVVLGKGARFEKVAKEGIVAGRSIKAMEWLAKASAKSEREKNFSRIFEKTGELMNKNPKLVEKLEKAVDFKLKRELKENNPVEKDINNILGKEKIDNSIKEKIKGSVLNFFRNKTKTSQEKTQENLEKRKAA
ncbi:MAG TPA: hypothetical protein P5323_01510 [Candidatus Moranbacteria bacterium]|nr:hypothetical protein [Candidatus Moranbacteria bacterium]HRY27791.1 hypothetical protein [Candidatus Moranbacteria bacterium]HSA08130.1 hypothetical protein [Candidatus Moranbacteria bacterium]